MRALRLYLDPIAPLTFVETTIAPADAPDARPWLTSIGDLALRARTGTFRGAFTNQNATLVVALDNRQRQASSLLVQPLRVRAEIDTDVPNFFVGIVQAIDYGTTLTLTLEA